MATDPPFRPGDVVRTKWYRDETLTERVVVRCFPVARTKSGWNVEVEPPSACHCCGRAYHEVPILDSSWFWLHRRNPDAPIHVEQPAHRLRPIGRYIHPHNSEYAQGDDDGS